jgi:hypothetical protein
MSSYLIRSSSNTHESTGRTPVGPRTIILLTYPKRRWLMFWWFVIGLKIDELNGLVNIHISSVVSLEWRSQFFPCATQTKISELCCSLWLLITYFWNPLNMCHVCIRIQCTISSFLKTKLQNHQTVKKSSYPIPLLMTSTHNYEPYHLKSKTYKNTQKTEWKSSLTV